MEPAFEQKVETFYEENHTESMSTPSPSVKDRLDLLREVLSSSSTPANEGYQLWVKHGAENFWVSLEKTITIGADASSDIRFDERWVSGKHCQITCDEKGWKVLDLDSKNGTHVNGLRTSERQLYDGDIINIGDCVLIFVDSNKKEFP